ncbi:MAG: helix-turn-helix domain-containing protein [Tannerellaceae bacterium]|nr:helix-turn-helix domain-containing protein [Tannerellaceae bacterium]
MKFNHEPGSIKTEYQYNQATLEKNGSYAFFIEEMCTPVIEVIATQEVELRNGIAGFNGFVFVLEGECRVCYDHANEIIAKDGEFFFIPYYASYNARLSGGTYLVVIRLTQANVLFGRYKLHLLDYKKASDSCPEHLTLPIHPILLKYFEGIICYLQTGVTGSLFYEIKVRELFLLFSEFYTRQEIAGLMNPILSRDISFTGFVLENWRKVNHARELAALSSYCESAFNRKFKEVFGETPYRWLSQKRSDSILNELKHTNKNFKTIAEEFRFNTLQQLNNYCKCHFKKTPGEIRREVDE